MAKCAQCGKPLNPVAAMLGPVCGACCKANQAYAAGRGPKPRDIRKQTKG